MTADERDIQFGTTTILKLFAAEEIALLREVAQQFPGTVVEAREKEGQEYRPMIISASQLKYLNRKSVVPKGYEHVAVTTDPRNFPSIWHVLAEAKQKAT